MAVKEIPVAVTVTAVYKNGYSFESLKSDMQSTIDGYFTELSAYPRSASIASFLQTVA
jgi:hypothetical protein